MVMPNFKGGKALHASDLNAIVTAIQRMIVAGAGIVVQRVNSQVMISAATKSTGRNKMPPEQEPPRYQ